MFHRLRVQNEVFVEKQRAHKHLMEYQNHNLSELLKAIEVNDEKEIVKRLRRPFNDPVNVLTKDRGLYRLSIKLWIKTVCHANPKIREAFRQIRIFNKLQLLLGEANVNLEFINKASIDRVDGVIEIYRQYNSERQNVLFYCLHVGKKLEAVLKNGRVFELNPILETLPKNESGLSLALQRSLSEIKRSRDLRSFDYEGLSRNWSQYYAAQLNDIYKKIHAAKQPDKKLDIPESFFNEEKEHINSLTHNIDYSLGESISRFVYHYFINGRNIESRLLPFFKEIFALFDQTTVYNYPSTNSGNWIHIILNTENEDLLAQLFTKEIPLDDVYFAGSNTIKGEKREVFLRMIMPYFCEIPLKYFEYYSQNLRSYYETNINDLIFLEIERRKRVTKIVADEVQYLPIILITIIASYYTLIPDTLVDEYCSLFPAAPIATKLPVIQIAKKANPNVKETPLSLAAYAGSSEAVKMLLPATEKQGVWYKRMMFESHDSKEWFEILKLLKSNGADFNAVNAWSQTVLELVLCEFSLLPSSIGEEEIRKNHISKILNFLDFLLENGADINKKNSHCDTPLHIFFAKVSLQDTENCLAEIINRFLRKGFKINTQNNMGRTLLHIAVQKKSIPAVKYLLDQTDIDINLPDNKGLTPLHLAAAGFPEMTEFLISQGANIHALTKEGETPEAYSRKSCEREQASYTFTEINGKSEFAKPYLQAQKFLSTAEFAPARVSRVGKFSKSSEEAKAEQAQTHDILSIKI